MFSEFVCLQLNNYVFKFLDGLIVCDISVFAACI